MFEALTACGLGLASIWSILCRVSQMKSGVTRPIVFVQHALLALAVMAYLLFPRLGPTALLAGISAFLLLGSHRWKDGAPEGTKAGPRRLTAQEARNVVGGSRD